MEVYVIKVTLVATKPPVWRRILVPREITLHNLHRTLQTVMGWTNAHLHQFVLPGSKNFGLAQGRRGKIANENRTTLGALLEFPGAKLLYEYDFGDSWRHELVLERVLVGDESFRQVCVAGARPCPPEDSGGPQGMRSCSWRSRTKPIPSTKQFGNGWVMTLHLAVSSRTRSIDNCGVGVGDADRAAPDKGTNPPRAAMMRPRPVLTKEAPETR